MDMHQSEDQREDSRVREESGVIGELKVQCLWDDAVLLVRGTIGAVG